MEDEEQRRKMLADLDELEAMVSATLAFGRDVAGSEPAVAARPRRPAAHRPRRSRGRAPAASATPSATRAPSTSPSQARPVALKRAIANLISNALAYAGSARIVLEPPAPASSRSKSKTTVPAFPPDELERVFEPFHRLETSRNRETGGTGLGLPITRNISAPTAAT